MTKRRITRISIQRVACTTDAILCQEKTCHGVDPHWKCTHSGSSNRAGVRRHPPQSLAHLLPLLIDQHFEVLKFLLAPACRGQIWRPTLDHAAPFLDFVDIFSAMKKHYSRDFTYRLRRSLAPEGATPIPRLDQSQSIETLQSTASRGSTDLPGTFHTIFFRWVIGHHFENDRCGPVCSVAQKPLEKTCWA